MRVDRRRLAARLPLALVVLALVSALVVPAVLQVRETADREIISEVLLPATARIAEIQIAIALEAAHTRAYMLTSDRVYAEAYQGARARRVRAVNDLVQAMRLVGPAEYALALRIRDQAREVTSPMDSLYAGLLTPLEYRDRLSMRHQRLAEVMATTYALARDLEADIARYNARVVQLGRVGMGATAVLVLLALAAAFQVARLARNYGELVERLDARARRQTELRETAAALNAGVTEAEAAETIAGGAMRSIRALGAYVERAEAPGPGFEVEVIGVAGEGTPPLRTRVPYPGSLTEALVESPDPYLLHEVSKVGRHMAPYLIERCSGCKGLIAPIAFAETAVGALVLLRSAEDEPFSAEEALYAAFLADLSSTTFRRVALTEAVRESEERFRQIADHLQESIWLSDPGFRELHYANPAYERLWGRGPDGRLLLVTDQLEAIHPDDRDTVAAAFRGLPQDEYEIEFRIVRPDGQIRWVRSRAYPIRNERGEVYRVAGITEDITEHKLAEQEREKLLQRAEEARAEAERRRDELQWVTESRARLMRGFGHDVKNPLGAADGFLQLMEEGVVGELTEKQLESVSSARRSIGAALDLIDQLLELARAEVTGIELEIAPTDLRSLVRESAEEYRAQAESQGLELTTEVSDEVPVIESDASRIRQIIGNLLSNAVKFTERGSVTVRAGTREGEGAPGPGRWVAIDVVDTGPGISPEQQRRLFQEFSRVAETGKKGTGIGLAISRRLARALGGEITLQSEVGKGSTFTLWLPAEPTAAPADIAEMPRQAAD